MLKAELHKKLGEDASKATSRSEDVLTSTFFGLLSYLPGECFLAAMKGIRWFEASRGGEVSHEPFWKASDLDGSTYRFWHRFPGFGEIDLMIETPSGLIGIEVKYLSEMSNKNEDDCQLVRYWQGLREQSFGSQNGSLDLIYITKDSAPPRDEINLTMEKGIRYDTRVGWISWLRIHRNLEDLIRNQMSSTNLEKRILDDLIEYLKCRNLNSFDGFKEISNRKGIENSVWFNDFITSENLAWPLWGQAPMVPRWSFSGE